MSGQSPWLIECEVFLFTHEIMDNFRFNIRWHFARYLHKIEISGGIERTCQTDTVNILTSVMLPGCVV